MKGYFLYIDENLPDELLPGFLVDIASEFAEYLVEVDLVVGELPLLTEDQASVHTQAQKLMQNLNLPSTSYYSFYKLLLVS